jgi:hypothetical protein
MIPMLSFSHPSKQESRLLTLASIKDFPLLTKLLIFYFRKFKVRSYKNDSLGFALSVPLSCQSAVSQ